MIGSNKNAFYWLIGQLRGPNCNGGNGGQQCYHVNNHVTLQSLSSTCAEELLVEITGSRDKLEISIPSIQLEGSWSLYPTRKMTDSNELRAQRDLQSALGRITIAGAMVADPRSEIIGRHNEEIEALKTKIQEKDEEILRLNKEIKRLRAENDRKDKKIEQLENRIEELEHDKTDLETKLDSVQKQVTNLKEENKASREMVDNLERKLNSVQVELATERKENKASREMLDNLERKFNKEITRLKEEKKASRKEADEMSKKVEEITLRFQFNDDVNMILKKEIKELKETARNQIYPLYLPDVTEQAIEKAFLYLGEMCSRIQSMMYQSVLPDSYDDKSWYQIEEIEEAIEEEINDTGPKEEAKRRWADLKETLKWDQKSHLKMIKSLKWRRNKTAHPPLDETTLKDSLDVMKKYDKIGSREVTRIEELIHMWKTLKQLQPKL